MSPGFLNEFQLVQYFAGDLYWPTFPYPSLG